MVTVPKGKTQYREYLFSPEWQDLRLAALYVYNYRCQFCGSKKYLNVHHLRYYKTIFNPSVSLKRRLRWLVVVCKDCHAGIHQISKRDNLEPLKATKKFQTYTNKNYYRLNTKDLQRKTREYREKIIASQAT